ncbi:hypothetical protein [Hymenobacter chitinivorans]|uniref:Uncharacterized protein n=1 Tax=Hymenobacter chitinivorans DSM 11115 TaxID=1121954 RepID=A0A2M9BQ85_9BACT|nr:hypothetical protein [Hymenobacter chitinivorans]PJJ60062.1 hypothetical protein CLV45_1487 [Hymenobacter chitinivorans DSM 11115]
MGALLTDLLQRAQRSRRVVAVQTGGPMFLGYVLSHNAELLLLRTLTRQGLPTGVQTLSMQTVTQVHFDDRYVRLIEFKEHNPEVVYGLPAAPDGISNDDLSVAALLQKAHETHQLLQLETYADTTFYGYVARLTEDELLLEVYTQFAEADGHSVMDVDSIRSVVWSNEDTRTIELLRKQPGALSKGAE